MKHETNLARGIWWREPLVMALCVSLLLHGLFYGTWRVGRAYGWWNVSMPFLSRILERMSALLVDPNEIQEALEHQRQRAAEEMPLMFADVSPAQATVEKPDKAQFYGPLNAVAASTEASPEDAELPKIEGEQDKEFRTTDVPRNLPEAQPAPPTDAPTDADPTPAASDADRLQPASEPEVKAAGEPEAAEAPVPVADTAQPGTPEPLRTPAPVTPNPGDLIRAPVSTQPDPGEEAARRGDRGDTAQPRPRTIAQARAQLPQETGIVGQKMNLDGASRMQRVMSSFNTEGTIWGSYDAKLIAIIKNQWYHFLDQHPEAFNWAGRVVVKFHLQYDGRVTDLEVLENTSGEMQGYGAQKAIMRDFGQPYDPWPPSARRMTDKDYRELRFTFYYN